MENVLLVFQVILTIFVSIVVLLQKSSSIGLGAYSGSNESLFGAKGPTSFLARVTMVLGLFFIINTIALSYLYNKRTSIVDSLPAAEKSVPSAPSNGQSESSGLENKNLDVDSKSLLVPRKDVTESGVPSAPIGK